MKTIPLGKTGLTISPIGLGCWQFSDGRGFSRFVWPPLSAEAMRDIVRICVEGGITWFDTAEAYGNGASERALSASLKALGVAPGRVLVATKWMPVLRTAASLKKTFPGREAALSPYPVDLHQVHMPLSLSSVPRQMEAMADLVAERKIKAVGVSNFSAKKMEEAHRALEKRGLVLASNQVRYHLLERGIETNGVLETARDLGVTVIAYSPLAQGVLSGKFHDNPGLVKRLPLYRRRKRDFSAQGLERSRPLVAELQRTAARYGATPSEVALAWLLGANRGVVAAIPGATKPEHARINAGALALDLTREEIAKIGEISLKAIAKD